MTGNELLYEFNLGESLTKDEYERLETYLKYYSGKTVPHNSWFHNHLNDLELKLMQDGANAALIRVQDIMRMKGFV